MDKTVFINQPPSDKRRRHVDCPGAPFDDGLFEVNVIGDLSLAKIFVNLANLYNGRILKTNKVGWLTLTAEVNPAALKFVVAPALPNNRRLKTVEFLR